jgi:hypothetical protein
MFHGDQSPVYVGFEVDNVAMCQVLFSWYFGFAFGQSLICYGLNKQNKLHENKEKYSKLRARSDKGQTSI